MTFTVAKDDLNMGEARIVTRASLAPVIAAGHKLGIQDTFLATCIPVSGVALHLPTGEKIEFMAGDVLVKNGWNFLRMRPEEFESKWVGRNGLPLSSATLGNAITPDMLADLTPDSDVENPFHAAVYAAEAARHRESILSSSIVDVNAADRLPGTTFMATEFNEHRARLGMEEVLDCCERGMTDAEDLQGSLLLVTAAFEGLYEFMKDGAENGVDMGTVRVDVHGLPETHGRGFCAVAAHMGTLGMRCEESGWLDPDVFREAVADCRKVLTPDFYKALNR